MRRKSGFDRSPCPLSSNWARMWSFSRPDTSTLTFFPLVEQQVTKVPVCNVMPGFLLFFWSTLKILRNSQRCEVIDIVRYLFREHVRYLTQAHCLVPVAGTGMMRGVQEVEDLRFASSCTLEDGGCNLKYSHICQVLREPVVVADICWCHSSN